jgi:hypothetical protein
MKMERSNEQETPKFGVPSPSIALDEGIGDLSTFEDDRRSTTQFCSSRSFRGFHSTYDRLSIGMWSLVIGLTSNRNLFTLGIVT